MKGDKWRTVKYALETVRPFVFDTVTLKDQTGLEPEQPEEVAAFLEEKVQKFAPMVPVRSIACVLKVQTCDRRMSLAVKGIIFHFKWSCVTIDLT